MNKDQKIINKFNQEYCKKVTQQHLDNINKLKKHKNCINKEKLINTLIEMRNQNAIWTIW